MSGSYASRLRSGGGSGVGAGGDLGTTTALAAKVVFASAAVAAAASLARLAVPQLVVSVAAGADAFLWKLYLFVAVHVIIFVIWKLSDNKHFHHHKADPWVDEQDGGVKRKEGFVSVSGADALQAGVAARRKDSSAAPAARGPPPPPVVSGFIPKEDFFSPAGYGVPLLQKKFSPMEEAVSPDSGVGESCVTTEREEADDSFSSSSSAAAADEWRSMAPAPLQRADLSLPLPPPATAAMAMDHCFDAADDGDDDLDATWNAIMQKKRPSTAPASSTPPAPQAPPPAPPAAAAARPRAREPSVGAAELSKRADDFIKKIHHSFGRQQ